jgi:RNA polymerase sigma-70 factor (ECF subfamily)
VAQDAQPPDWTLERYREYLRMLARVRLVRLDPLLRSKLDPSDLVQETLYKAVKSRDQFRGKTEGELAAYLRRILANTIADWARGADNIALHSLQAELEQYSTNLSKLLPAEQSSPSDRLIREEQLVQMADALAKLPEAQRTAVELRYLHVPPYSLAMIAAHLSGPDKVQTEKGAAGLLGRGLKKLRELLHDSL